MKFELIDRLLSATPTQVVGVKHVTLAEEYLADHFPTFPVLPGVLMLEAATQACGWMLHLRNDFRRPVVVLKEARNVKYGHFVAPGQVLRVESEWIKGDEAEGVTRGGSFKVTGVVQLGERVAEGTGRGAEKTAFTAKLEVVCFSLSEKAPGLGHLDGSLVRHARERWNLIAPHGSAKVSV